jgi:hypothetical protein
VQTLKFQPSEVAAGVAPVSFIPPRWGKEPSAFRLIRAASSDGGGGGVGAAACATPNEAVNAIAAIAASLRYLPGSAVYLEAIPQLAKWRNRSLSLLRPVMNIHYGHFSFPDSFPDITLENSNKQSRPTMSSSAHCHR